MSEIKTIDEKQLAECEQPFLRAERIPYRCTLNHWHLREARK